MEDRESRTQQKQVKTVANRGAQNVTIQLFLGWRSLDVYAH